MKKTNQPFVMQKHSLFANSLLPVIQNLTALGCSEADIGALVGYQGKDTHNWLESMKQTQPEVREALKIGRKIADANLVAKMYQQAIGYEYEEVEEEYKEVQDPSDPEKTKTIKIGTKVKKKFQPGNSQTALFLATNHLPEQYKHRIETIRKGFILNATTELSGEQIERLAGTLMDTAREVKKIECRVIEKEIDVKSE